MNPLVDAPSSSKVPDDWRGRARENFRAAASLISNSLFAPAATRLYYAVFQGVVAKLLEKGMEAKKLSRDAYTEWPHGVVRNHVFFATGIGDDRITYDELYGMRTAADYLVGKVLDTDVKAIADDARKVLKRLGVVA